MEVLIISSKLQQFLDDLEPQAQLKVHRAFALLEHYGNKLGMPYSKHVRGPLFTLRIKGNQEVRIFYCFRNDFVLLLHGFIKKSWKIPPREITTALLKLREHDKV